MIKPVGGGLENCRCEINYVDTHRGCRVDMFVVVELNGYGFGWVDGELDVSCGGGLL